MTTIPSPSVMTVVAQQRGDELQAQAEHYRLARDAERIGAQRRSRRVDLAAIAGIVLALTLPIVASLRA